MDGLISPQSLVRQSLSTPPDLTAELKSPFKAHKEIVDSAMKGIRPSKDNMHELAKRCKNNTTDNQDFSDAI